MPSRRRLARVAAMQAVFESQIRPVDQNVSLEKNTQELGGETSVDCSFAEKLFSGVIKESAAIQKAVEEHAPEWPLQRMDTITRSILLIGAYELLFLKDAPPAVVMNEAIDIAKEYGSAESGKFVNGVLNALAHAKR